MTRWTWGGAAAALVTAAVLTATVPREAPAPTAAALIIAVVLVGAVAALVARWFAPWVVGAVVAVTVVVVSVAAGGDAVDPLRGPLGYANATAAWYAAGAGAACLVAVGATSGWVRVGGALAMVQLTLLPVAIGATGAVAVVGGLVLATIVAVLWPRGRRLVVAGAAAVTVLVVAGTTTVAFGGLPGLLDLAGVGAGGDGDAPVGVEARVRLWQEAAELVRPAPLTGHGADAFARLAPSGSDPDTAWAHHELLELAVEHGVAVPALVLLAVALGFVGLWRIGEADSAVAATVLTGSIALASIDHVWHVAVVPLTVAAVVGAALARTRPGDTDQPAPTDLAATTSDP